MDEEYVSSLGMGIIKIRMVLLFFDAANRFFLLIFLRERIKQIDNRINLNIYIQSGT